MGSAFFLWLPAAPVESLQSGGVRGHGPPGSPSREEQRNENERRREETGTRPTMLQSIADALLAELEDVMHGYAARVRTDEDTPSAKDIEEDVLEDHMATFLADIAATLASLSVDDENPAESVRDGTAIQRVVAQRHGAQRARLGFRERELRREFVILEQELRAAVHRRLPAIGATPTRESAVGEAERAMIFLHQALRIAEELSLQSFRRALAVASERGVSSEDQSL
jgi:hypothetical protein